MPSKRRTGTIFTEVTIDVEDVISELEDDDIRDECEERGIVHGSAATSDRLIAAARQRHEREHSGLAEMCRDEVCEAAFGLRWSARLRPR